MFIESIPLQEAEFQNNFQPFLQEKSTPYHQT